MVAPRAVWKGFLKVGSVTCGIKIVGAASEASKIHFKILNRKDGLPVKSVYADEKTGEPVETEDEVEGFEVETDEFLQIEPDDIKALKLTSDHTLEVVSSSRSARSTPAIWRSPTFSFQPTARPSRLTA